MQELTVNLDQHSYNVTVDSGVLNKLGEILYNMGFPRKVAVITNAVVDDLYGEILKTGLVAAGMDVTTIIIPEGETHKNLSTVEAIAEQLVAADFDRSTGLIALGGGIVGDVTGFVAASFLRGIPFIQIPTTLLSQVDSSVGGKTGVNLKSGKNLVGAFNQPKLVVIDVATLSSLPEREFAAGMAEVIKHGIIADAAYADWLLENRDAILAKEKDILIEMVAISCRIKAAVVGEDERESSLRAILNFGHTFGHAVETLTDYAYLHGEAVAIGMLVAAELSQAEGLCTREDVSKISLLLKAFELPSEIPRFSRPEYLAQMMRDKKVRNGKLRMVLNRGIGACEIRELVDIDQVLSNVFDEDFQPLPEQPSSESIASIPPAPSAGGSGASLGRIAEYVSRLERNSGDAVFVDLAAIYLKIDMVEDALLVAQKGVQANPTLSAGQVILGKILEKLGRESDALDAYRRAAEAGSEDSRILRKVINAMLRSGEKQQVRPLVERLVAVAPDDAKAAQLLQSLPGKDSSQGVISAGGATKGGKKSTINTATIAEIYLKQGLYQEALNVYTGILEDAPDNVEAQQKVAEVRSLLAGGAAEPEIDEVASSPADNDLTAEMAVENGPPEESGASAEVAQAEAGSDLRGTLENWLDAIHARRAHVS